MTDITSLTPEQFQVLDEIAYDEELKQLIINMMNAREILLQRVLQKATENGLKVSTEPYVDHVMNLFQSKKELGSFISESLLRQRKAELDNFSWSNLKFS